MQKIGEILVSKGYVTQQQLDGVMAVKGCLLYTSPSPRDPKISRMPSSA